VGRTGRAGKTGEAVLLLADDERGILPQLKQFPLKAAGSLGTATAAGRVAVATKQQGSSGDGFGGWGWDGLAAGLAQVARDQALLDNGDQAFVATLGYLAGEEKMHTTSIRCSICIALCFWTLLLPRYVCHS
jgi:hypothetical protein